MDGGRPFDIKPAGMLALDVARVEAGLLLIDVDFFSSKKALIDGAAYTPFEMGLGTARQPRQGRFVGQQALATSTRRARAQIVGLEVDWTEVERSTKQRRPAAALARRPRASPCRSIKDGSRSARRRRRRGRRC